MASTFKVYERIAKREIDKVAAFLEERENG